MKFRLFPEPPKPTEQEIQLEKIRVQRTQARAGGFALFMLATIFGSAAVVAVTRRAQKAEYDW